MTRWENLSVVWDSLLAYGLLPVRCDKFATGGPAKNGERNRGVQ